MSNVKNWLSLVRLSHTVFALPFAFIGFSLAIALDEYSFSWRLFVLVLLCMVFARNAAMSFNRLVDNEYDAINPRTLNREIPRGIISKRAATIFVIINSLLFIITTSFINRLTLYLSPIALFVVLGYSLSKRITSLCHFLVGLGLSLAPIGAYISVTSSFALHPIIYSLVVLTWTGGFDIIYSLQDYQFDKDHHLRSIPSVIGKKNALLISGLVHLVTVALVVFAGIYGNSGPLFWVGAFIYSALLVFQHAIVKHNDLSRVNLAFGTTNGIASVIFAIFVIIDLFI